MHKMSDIRANIRPIVLGLARNGNKVLVSKAYDKVKDQEFYRFLGGGIEFRETIENALKREFKEELNEEIEVLDRVCFVENFFTYENKKGHELVFIHEIKLPDDCYEKKELKFYANESVLKVLWIDRQEFVNKDKILYPEEVIEFL